MEREGTGKIELDNLEKLMQKLKQNKDYNKEEVFEFDHDTDTWFSISAGMGISTASGCWPTVKRKGTYCPDVRAPWAALPKFINGFGKWTRIVCVSVAGLIRALKKSSYPS